MTGILRKLSAVPPSLLAIADEVIE